MIVYPFNFSGSENQCRKLRKHLCWTQHGQQVLVVHKFLAEDGQRADLSCVWGGSPPPQIELSIWANSMWHHVASDHEVPGWPHAANKCLGVWAASSHCLLGSYHSAQVRAAVIVTRQDERQNNPEYDSWTKIFLCSRFVRTSYFGCTVWWGPEVISQISNWPLPEPPPPHTCTHTKTWNQSDPARGDGDVMICEEQKNYFSVNYPEGNFSSPRKHYVFGTAVSCGPLMDSTPCAALRMCVCVCRKRTEKREKDRARQDIMVGAPSALTLVDDIWRRFPTHGSTLSLLQPHSVIRPSDVRSM